MTSTPHPNQLSRRLSGPFDITLLANPVSPIEGLGSRFSVRVLNAVGGAPVTDASVEAIANEPDGRVSTISLISNPVQAEWYEAPVGMREGGSWNFTISVTSPKGVGTLDAVINVSKTHSAGLTGEIGWLVLLAVIGGGTFFVWHRFVRKPRPPLV